MNKLSTDENLEHESDESPDDLWQCLNDDDIDDDYSAENITSHDQFYGRWAAEKWLIRVYLHRCHRFLLSRFRSEKPDDSTSHDELPF